MGVGRFLRHLPCVEVDFPVDMNDSQARVLVEDLASSPQTDKHLKGSSRDLCGLDSESGLSSASTSLPTFDVSSASTIDVSFASISLPAIGVSSASTSERRSVSSPASTQ